MSTQPWLIMGAGVVGLSTARHLLMADPNADVTIVSCDQPGAPSNDITKIFRIDYAAMERMKSVRSTLAELMADELLKEHLRDVGGRILIWEEKDIPTLDAINRCRSQLGLKPRELLDRTVLNNIYGTCRVPGGPVYTHNDDDLLMVWNEGIMKAMKDDILRRSRKSAELTIREKRVEKLIWEGSQITGLALADGDGEIDARRMKVVLAAGAWTSDVLYRSSIKLPHSSRVPVAAAVFQYKIRISGRHAEFFVGKPIVSDLGICELLPPIGSEVKVNYIALSCTNVESGSPVSRPKDLRGSSLAIYCMLELVERICELFPELRKTELEIVSCGVCWDGITASQNPIIALHPDFENLVVAAGMSFTSAKDVFVGRDVVDVGNGKDLPRCGWDPIPPSPDNNQPLLLPQANFEELEIMAEQDPRVRKWKAENQDSQTWWLQQ